ncbi:MAG: membrane protein insertion efficiency factor YidD [Deltaproteobacteria bacterium]|nr:membrane protein insertion efficiency factor YidD [Deltaproteobacteria bacterium]
MRFVFRLYKLFVSPLIGNRCRFYPSCSDYFVLSLSKHGFLRGTLKGILRLCRCNPFFQGGFDPV